MKKRLDKSPNLWYNKITKGELNSTNRERVDTMSNTKTTYRSAVEYAVKNLADAPQDVLDKLTALAASLEKKSGAERKPTATQVANEGYKSAIVDFLGGVDKPQTVTDILKGVPALEGFSNQKVSALMTQLKDAGVVVKTSDKRRSYFALA
jgi:hypothetical protein